MNKSRSEKKGDGRRVSRVEKEVQQIVANYITRGLKNPLEGLITVSRVMMPGDLRSAKVYISVLGGDSDVAIKSIQHEAGDIQHYLSSQLPMRYCPKITFYKDDTTENVLRIERIIDQLGLEGRQSISKINSEPSDNSSDQEEND